MEIVSADFGGRRLRRRVVRWLIAVVALVVFLGVLPQLLRLYSEWLWFRFDVRYPGVFWTILKTKLGLGLVFALAFLVLLLGNVELARRLARRTLWYDEERLLRQRFAEVMEYFVGRYLYLALVALALVAAYAVGVGAAGQWNRYLLFGHAASFQLPDPVFKRDIGFYVFRLPFWQWLWQWLYGVLIAVFVLTAATHYFDKAIRVLRGIPALAPHVNVHLSVLLALILAVKAIGYRIEAFYLLYSERGAAFGAGYTDLNAQLLAYNVLFVIAVACAMLALINIVFRGLWLPLAGIGFLAVSSLLLNVAYPALVQRLQVQPAEFEREKPYIERNIEFTRRGFDLADIRSRQMTKVKPVTMKQVARNVATVENVRLWDYRPLLTTYRKQQELQQYYTFNSVDIDRYTIQGRYRQVMLSARELQGDNLPEKSWQNIHIFWTHGYGIVMSPVTDAVQSGLPNYVILDIPPRSRYGLKVTRSGIYYGELTNDYVIVGTAAEENDYPITIANTIAKTRYSGKGGVPIGSSLSKLAAAVRFSDLNILISTLITSKSRILWGRNIAWRARHIAPFLSYDRDPYIVLGDDGHLYWMHDAYTLSSMYPYSRPYGSEEAGMFNYVRNSVKVVTDAYDGTVSFYVADPSDPIIRAYGQVFPGMFHPMREMPAGLLAHIRYPEALFNAQSAVLTLYHVTEPQVFYSGSEKWEVGREGQKTVGAVEQVVRNGEEQMQAYYAIVSLPERIKSEFLLMLPFTPRAKPNMVAWLAGQCDGADYGRKLLYEFPKTEQVWGPIQIEAAINQNADFSSRKTLLNQQGSNFFPGNLLVLPMDDSILYVEPYYLSATTGAIPELKSILVARGDGRIAFGDTFSQALTNLLGEPTPGLVAEEPTWLGERGGLPPAPLGAPTAPPPSPVRGDLRGLAAQANQQLKEALDRQRKGDWAGYGETLEKLQKTLEEMSKAAGA
jgi:hypothetical protein